MTEAVQWGQLPGVDNIPLRIVQDDVLEPSINDTPTVKHIEQFLIEQGAADYRQFAERLSLSDSEQFGVVRQIEAAHTQLDVDLEEIARLKHQLFTGNLTSIFDTAMTLKRTGHRTRLEALIAEGNRLARLWINREYGTAARASKAPLYPTDILCSEYVKPKLAAFIVKPSKSQSLKTVKTGAEVAPTTVELKGQKPTVRSAPRSIVWMLAKQSFSAEPCATDNDSPDEKNLYVAPEASPAESCRAVSPRIAAFVLDNASLITTDLDDQNDMNKIKGALKALAGSRELDDPEIRKRFSFLQGVLANHARIDDQFMPHTELLTARTFLQSTLGSRPDWQKDGLCSVEPLLDFFPGRGESVTAQKELCAECPVQDKCLEFALQKKDKFGIWGGLSERQRRQVRRAIRAGAEPEAIKSLIDDLRIKDESDEVDFDEEDAD